MSMLLVRLWNVQQNPLIRLIERFRQLRKDAPHAWRETMSQNFQLTYDPTKPDSKRKCGLSAYDDALTCHQLYPPMSLLPTPCPHLAIFSYFCRIQLLSEQSQQCPSFVRFGRGGKCNWVSRVRGYFGYRSRDD